MNRRTHAAELATGPSCVGRRTQAPPLFRSAQGAGKPAFLSGQARPPPLMDKTNHHHHHRVVVSDGWPRIRGERETVREERGRTRWSRCRRRRRRWFQ
ncbi:hypothetical protein HanPI659440_Chr05g0183821 [Helianthus annuus]|nr:hypothetical protein HanPI659440_Chr05g0183821 [Helianthus annuus]